MAVVEVLIDIRTNSRECDIYSCLQNQGPVFVLRRIHGEANKATIVGCSASLFVTE